MLWLNFFLRSDLIGHKKNNGSAVTMILKKLIFRFYIQNRTQGTLLLVSIPFVNAELLE
jgi:hypothetical protein